MNKKQKKLKNNFFNNPNIIIGFFAFLALFSLIYSRYIISSNNLYTLCAYDEEIAISNVDLYIGYDINYFNGSNIIYSGNEKVTNYSIGYYFKDGTKISGIDSEVDGSSNEISLKYLIENSEFTLLEPHKKGLIIKKDKLDDIFFVIKATTKDGTKVDKKYNLSITKLTK